MWKWLQPRRYFRGAFGQVRASGLCRRDVPVTTARDAIGWWEARRVPFNLIVGTAGIFTCIVMGVIAAASWALFDSEFGMPDPPLFAVIGVLLYGFLANVCFTGGWITELFVRKVWPQESDRFATLSFSLGLLFSVSLTLSPGIVVGAAGVFRLLRHL